jgi:hypothetical protein
MVAPRSQRMPLWWLGQRDPVARFALYAVIIAALQGWILFNQLSAMKNENRPWVGFEIHQLNAAKRGEPLTAVVAIKNVGKSPAMKVHAQFRVSDLTFTAQDGVSECHGCSNSFLLPGADLGYPPITISGEKTDYKTNAPAIFGRVDYEDENGRGYWTTVCQYFEVAFSGLAACSAGNSAGNK